jgi:hypothetical protein
MSIEEFLIDYEKSPGWFNMLTPIQSIQEISQIYRPVINLHFVSTDLEDNQIYVQKNAKKPDGSSYNETRYSISRRGLLLLSSAADCHFLNTETKYNAETECFQCVSNIKTHDMSGGWRVITESKSVSKWKTFKNKNREIDPEASTKAESGAQNRCIRAALNIKAHYSKEQLEKPFVAVYTVLDARDEDVKHALIAGAVASNNLLFGIMKPLQQQLETRKVDTETGEVIEGEESKS